MFALDCSSSVLSILQYYFNYLFKGKFKIKNNNNVAMTRKHEVPQCDIPARPGKPSWVLQQESVSPVPLELWLLAKAGCSCYLLGPSVRLCFPGVTLYYLHKGPSNSCPLSFALPSAGLPRTPSLPHHSFSLWSLFC